MDNLMIVSTSLQKHIEIFTEVFDRFKKVNLIVQPNKCEVLKNLFGTEIRYVVRIFAFEISKKCKKNSKISRLLQTIFNWIYKNYETINQIIEKKLS